MKRGYLSMTESARLGGDYEEIKRMLEGLIEHVEREDRENRWRSRGRTDS
jgi:hypothetical protein